MKKLLILAGLLAVFSSPSFAKEKETFRGQDGKLHCLHSDGFIHGDGACACMPDSPGSCANAVGAGATGAAPPRKAVAQSTYVHKPDSTQYHPEGEGGIRANAAAPAPAARAYVHKPDSTQYHPEGEGGTKPKPAVGRAYVHKPDSTQYHPEGEGGTKPKAGVNADMPPRDIDKPLKSDK